MLETKLTNNEEDSNLDFFPRYGNEIIDEDGVNPYDAIVYKELKESLNYAISTLKPKEQEVIKLRYGLCGYEPHTLKEIAINYRVTSTTIGFLIKHIERKLSHPSRADKLKQFLE